MNALPFVVAIVATVSFFTFLAIASWGETRRREREALYRSEVLKKLAENPGGNSQQVLELFQQERKDAFRRRQEGLKLGGLVTSSVGAGILVFLQAMGGHRPVWMAGLIPLLVGGVLLIYAFLLAPRE